MASSLDFVQFVCEQLRDTGDITYKKMFGEYMVYVNARPILLICNNTVYVKMLDCIRDKMDGAEIGSPYNGAKPHYILDIDNAEFSKQVVLILETVTPIPTKRKTTKK